MKIIFILNFMVFCGGYARITFIPKFTFTPTIAPTTTFTSKITPVPEICTPEEGVCSCPNNEVFSPCIPDCGDFCNNSGESQVCIPQCVQGCTCKKGYCRDPWSHLCNSIQWRQCQGNNEHYEDGVVNDCCTNECKEACPGTGPKVCEEPCGQGCFCDPGYYRHPVTKSCVKKDCCPDSTTYSTISDPTPKSSSEPTSTDVSNIECRENETFTCSNECQEGCGNELEVCTKECYDGCWCDADHRRDPETGLCVLPEDCSCSCSTTVACGTNEAFSDCGPCGGDYYCSDREIQCFACGPPGCYCDPAGDYCRDENGNCVPRNIIIDPV